METLTVHEVGKKSAMVRSLRELERREEKEGRGFTQWGGVQTVVSPKRRKRRGSGMWTRARIESRQGTEKREKAHCASAA